MPGPTDDRGTRVSPAGVSPTARRTRSPGASPARGGHAQAGHRLAIVAQDASAATSGPPPLLSPHFLRFPDGFKSRICLRRACLARNRTAPAVLRHLLPAPSRVNRLRADRQVEPIQRRSDRLLAKVLKPLMIQPESPDGLPGCFVILRHRDLASDAEQEARFATVRAGRDEEVLLRGRWPVALPDGAERDIAACSGRDNRPPCCDTRTSSGPR